MAPQDGPHPEVMPNGGSGVGTHDLETGREFQWLGLREAAESYTPGELEASLKVHKALLASFKKKKKKKIIFNYYN